MKKVISMLLALLLVISASVPAAAADGKVIYDGNAQKFIFEPGSEYSPTDLFPNFKDVMPGDTVSQKITVKNEASNKVKVKIYMRALGAHENSVEFLSQLQLMVRVSGENTYLFQAAANETAQLTDWVCLGTLYSGGKVDLDVLLDVPVELDNQFQNAVGYLDWEFKVEEYPVEPGDPMPPPTGDSFSPVLWVSLLAGSMLAIVILLLIWRKKKETEKQ